MLVDAHAHISGKESEHVEALLTAMRENEVDKTLLVQRVAHFDNSYIFGNASRYPGQFAAVCRVDVNTPQALTDLERCREQGAVGLRLNIFDRSPGPDPLAIWKKAQALGMTLSINGSVEKFASDEFARIVAQLSDLKFVFEHLLGMGLATVGLWSVNRNAYRPKPSVADFQRALKLADYPNTYIKIPGLGEICPLPFPFSDVPPYIKMAYDAFGPRRMMWGSDWPSVVSREGHRNALHYTKDKLSYCGDDDLTWIFGKTALAVWKFS